MSLAKWADIYVIHHWMIFWIGYTKLAWVGFEPTTNEFYSDALTHWAITLWDQFVLRANFLHLLQLHGLWSFILHFRHCLSKSPPLFSSKFSWGNHMNVAEWADTYGINNWRILSDSYRKLSWAEFELRTTELRSDTPNDWAIRPWVQLAPIANFIKLLQLHRLLSVLFSFCHWARQLPRFFSLIFVWGNHMSVVEWADK